MKQGDIVLDVRRLRCPMPLLKMKQTLHGMGAGQILQVITTDGGSARDFPVYLQQTDHKLLWVKKDDDEYQFWIECGA